MGDLILRQINFFVLKNKMVINSDGAIFYKKYLVGAMSLA